MTYSEFPDELIHADVMTVHEREEKIIAKQYRPINILTSSLKIYEKLMFIISCVNKITYFSHVNVDF